jgi:hypothetical protein
MDKYSKINDKIIQNDIHFANRRNSYKNFQLKAEIIFSLPAMKLNQIIGVRYRGLSFILASSVVKAN